ncbi:5-carboxymethyl-2-hydroxymuconate Delta-isomerase [Actinacidiphila acididurans]|uniref:Isomerase n=1 Tax=Actinacidiphila acididurans TaxID=2784346 RepID=A0ABS2TPZ9_9ACTN|nr:isomerase [Actinacidiphila acididurans]MBM9505384.1 isomerase [Actinacidiphila acididurans]
MPHTTVTYTEELAESEAFDFENFADDLHSALVTIAGAKAEACRTRFTGTEDSWFIADGDEEDFQAVHVEVAIKAGRTDEVRSELSRAVLGLIRKNLKRTPEFEVYLSVEVRDIDPVGYVSHVEPRQDA